MNPSLFIDATIVGIITLIIGTIVFNLTINRKNKDKDKPFGLHIAFFATGFLMHFIVELIGLNQHICNKDSVPV